MIIPENILSVLKNHKYKRDNFVNKTKYFYGSDSEDMWEKKVKENRKNYYINNPIEYKFNNFGYRTYDDFKKDKKGIVTLGCSFTEGIGLHLENTWSYKIAKYLDKPFYNLAVGGSGIRDSFERLISFGDYLNFDYVFLLVPPIGRVSNYFGDNEIVKNVFSIDQYVNFLPHSSIDNELVKWQRIIFNGSRYEEKFYEFTFLNLIYFYLKSKNKKLIYFKSSDVNQWFNHQDVSKIKCEDIESRDGHWGSIKQHYIFELFRSQYDNR